MMLGLMLMQIVVNPHLASISCPPRTQGTPTPHVQVAPGQYLLIVRSSKGNAQGMMRLLPAGTGSAHVDFHPVGVPLDSADVKVLNRSDSTPTTVAIGGSGGITLLVYRLNAGGFDGTWSAASGLGGGFCAFPALNRSP